MRLSDGFRKWCLAGGREEAVRILEKDWSRMVTFYGFPKEH